ncbi:tyrosine-type recombinase/integrase [Dyadobacter frigoris]|uniref:Integrase n=1 Tax=Dyadobacter frigoris TaxID=2576211 RepID=A0A4U6CX42_9BACT|nr:tyrosine-type recombinase/integrase [Dyadobacter frigoris]TKT85974.1 integrase [Dyadobacter frigoris]
MKENQTIDELVNEFEKHLLTLQRSRFTIRQYWQTWKPLKLFMAAHNIEYYNQSVGQQFIKSRLGDYDYNMLNQMQKRLVNVVDALYVFQSTGQIFFGTAPLRRNPPKILTGEIGLAMQDYINYKSATFTLSKSTINNHLNALHGLLVFLNDKKVGNLNQVKEAPLLSFIKSLNPETLSVNHSKLGIIRGFLSYLHTEQILGKDYSKVILRTNCKQQPRLPSFFSPEEVSLIVNAVDRANATGKRDYAMVLLAAKFGMRVSDIARLKFENINWDKGTIEFIQFKTGKAITFPLLSEVGNAIIDYLKYARPVCDQPCCFVQHIYPYKTITADDVAGRIGLHIRRSGIPLEGRRKGAHALRHSFATHLLANKIPLPVISEVLGHSQTASTMFYLRVDETQLKQCALDVPMVMSGFYGQKGGFNS